LRWALRPASAQTIKIGFITSYSGLNGNLGPYMERGMRLYLKGAPEGAASGGKHRISHPGRHRPQSRQGQAARAGADRVRDKVNLLAGVIFTPNAMAMAPLATEAKAAVHHHERGHGRDHDALALHRAPVVHPVAVLLSARPMGGEEIQRSTRW